jgi:serine/threonine protein kinase
MGAVYRATDTSLDRQVAIKVLPDAFADDAERLGRFEREAKTLAALNHPHIAAIYGLEKSSGVQALVLELVDGEDLSQRIGRGAIPLDEALAIAKQIAEALEAAHEQGIIHRDLKPANIKVRADGTVKVLDFGLAKALDPTQASSASATNSPTITSPAMTAMGIILGTAGYMAPEQAKGKAVDRRADIWAFGVVLYEMLTGQPLFTADTIPETLAQVMTRPINVDSLPAATPRRIRHLLVRCLDRDPKKRLRDIGEARIQIEDALAGVGEESSRAAGMASAEPRSLLPWLAAGVATLASAALAVVHFREVPVVVPLITSSLTAPEGSRDSGFSDAAGTPELSPDGKWVVFVARTADNKAPLWIRPLSSSTPRVLTGTDGATFPFWSPDSRYVAFFADGELKKIDITGGPPVAIADAPTGRGGSWSPEGVIVFARGAGGPLFKMAASGGTPTPATTLDGSPSHRFPWFLPDGRHFLFEDQPSRSGNDVVLRIGVLDAQQTVEIGKASSNAVYSSGHLLFLRDDTLMAQPFDPDKLTVRGEAIPVAERVSAVLTGGRKGVFSVSGSGLLAYQTGGRTGQQKLSWFDRTSKVVGTLGEPGRFSGLELSPDRKSAAVIGVDATDNMDVWIYDIARNLSTRLTFDPTPDRQPVWSADGRSLVWTNAGSKRTVRRKSADGHGTEDVLYEGALDVTSSSPDGRSILFDKASTGTGIGIWSLPLTPDTRGQPSTPAVFVDTPSSEGWGVFSPDGNWVAYTSNESQQSEIYVMPLPGPGGKRQISTAGGIFPRWRRDGKEIFYVGLDGGLMAADVTLKASSIDVGQVKPVGITVPAVVDRRSATLFVGFPYDVSLDGQRILAITEPEGSSAVPLTLVQNWTSLLK